MNIYLINGRKPLVHQRSFKFRLFLKNQYILYEKQLYQYVQGGACNSSLMILLANIYMFYWQQDLLKLLTNSNEIFGRLAILSLLFLINVALVCNDHSIF